MAIAPFVAAAPFTDQNARSLAINPLAIRSPILPLPRSPILPSHAQSLNAAEPKSRPMGKKKGNKEGGDAKKEAKSKGEGENKKEGENGVTAVLKMDMHCEGCADKIVKLAKNIDGVEKAKAEWEANKLTVRGEMDPSELREELQEKTKKKVDLVSPQLPKKEKDRDNKSSASPDNNNKAKDKKAEDKKPKEPPVTTAVLKLELHCEGCIDKIYKIASKTKGVQNISFDKDKGLVTVTGAMDVKALVESVREKIKRPVEVVQPKKDKDGGGGNGGGGKKNKKSGGNGGKEEGDGSGEDGAEESYYGGGAGEYFGRNRMEHNEVPLGYMNNSYTYNYGVMYGSHLHAPQMFSDENPNACHVM